MAEELGRIQKPSVEEFREGKKLVFVPLLFAPGEEADVVEKVNRYWDQVDTHIANLEAKLGEVKKVFHEMVHAGGEEGAKAVEELNKGSHRIVRSRMAQGAELEPLEDGELLNEFVDWNRCLLIGLQSQAATSKVYEFYMEAQKKRNEHMAKRIEEALGEGGVGLLLMREVHQVQFPADVQVFYVSPPALDEIRRWLRDMAAQAQRPSPEGAEEAAAGEKAETEERSDAEDTSQPEGSEAQ